MLLFQWASSSVYYLLGLWSRLVSSVPYLKGDAPSLLDEFVPKITEGFITSRLDSAQVWILTKITLSFRIVWYCRFYVFLLVILDRLTWRYFRASTWQCWPPSRSAWLFSISLQIPGWIWFLIELSRSLIF